MDKHNHTEASLPLLSMSGDSEVLRDTVLGVGQVIGRSVWVKLVFVLFVCFLFEAVTLHSIACTGTHCVD